MSRDLTVDRRILKAFYTQYVAVLLIVLVSSIGLASQGIERVKRDAVSDTREPAEAAFGEMKLMGLFSGQGSSQLYDGRELEAIVEMLRNHDVRTTFTVYAPSHADMRESFMVAVSRARSIRVHVEDAKVPAHTVRFVVAPASDPAVHAKVSFASMEASDESS